MQRRTGLKRRGRTRSDLERNLSENWAEGVRTQPCVVCSYDPLDPPEGDFRVIRGHHVLRKTVIKREAYRLGLFGENLIRVIWGDVRNRLPVCDPCHERHHGSEPMRLELVPAVAYDFAEELGLVGIMERDYTA